MFGRDVETRRVCSRVFGVARREGPETTHPVLSEARQQLADHIRRCNEARQRLDQLSAPSRLAAEAIRLETEAKRDLDAIAERERLAIKAWSETPTAPLPPSRTEEREAATAKLAKLSQEAAIARQNAEAFNGAVAEAHQSFANLHRQTTNLIHAVLLDEAERIASEYYAVIERAQMLQGMLRGLADILPPSHGRETVIALNRSTVEHRERLKTIFEQGRGLGRTIADKLASDPGASLE